MKPFSFWTGIAFGAAVTLLAVNCLPISKAIANDEKKPTAELEVPVEESPEPLLYELRTYYTPEGKLDALNARFRNHTMELFEKHGMKNVIYLTPTDKENTLVYLIAHKNAESAKESWRAFREDPQWKKVAAESERDGKLVEKVDLMYLKTTDYSPMK